MFSSMDVEQVRHVVQRILVPCVVVIGLLGNSVSIYVLTRKRMRCTTNIYLTALAITDIAYLTIAFLASLQHYEYIQRNSETYYACYGITMWLIDACAYISIYIAVCFTIERFIAIRYPLKRQTFCTESLAKKVLAGVALFCLLTTISTAFEHEYRMTAKLIDSHGKPCNLTLLATNTNTNTNINATAQPIWKAQQRHQIHVDEDNDDNHNGNDDGSFLLKVLKRGIEGDELMESPKPKLKPKMELELEPEPKTVEDEVDTLTVKRNATTIDAISGVTQPEERYQQKRNEQAHIPGIISALYSRGNFDFLLNAEFPDNQDTLLSLSSEGIFKVSTVPSGTQEFRDVSEEVEQNTCVNISYFEHTISDLGNNDLYRKVYYYFTLFVFVLIPLCVLGTFNCFLIMMVRRSKNVRGDLTNASSIRKSTKRKSNSSSVSQENRVTVTLIAVVLLFIICQLPWAIYLIVSEQVSIDEPLQAIFGNVFNFLAAINAAANFFLYCVLSDKYRKTVRDLITGYKYRKQRFNNNNYNNASLYTATSNGIGSSRRNRQPKISETDSKVSTSSPMIIK